jgi:hypothetical protein
MPNVAKYGSITRLFRPTTRNRDRKVTSLTEEGFVVFLFGMYALFYRKFLTIVIVFDYTLVFRQP